MDAGTISLVGAVLGGVSLMLVALVMVVFSITTVILCTKINKLEKRVKSLSSSDSVVLTKLADTSHTAEFTNDTSHHISSVAVGKPKQPKYENTVTVADDTVLPLPASPISSTALMDKQPEKSPDYTDVTGALPGFLRNDDMLMVQPVSEAVATAASRDKKTEQVPIQTIPASPKRWCSESYPPRGGTYASPQDAKAETSRVHAELSKKVSLGRGKEAPSAPFLRSPNDREDYTLVLDALPAGVFERVEGRRSLPEIMQRQSISEGSPVHSRKSGETSKSAEDSTSKTNADFKKIKTQSLRHHSPKMEGGSSPLRRKSQPAKELVRFSPQTGFKLAKEAQAVPEVNGEETDGSNESENRRVFDVPTGNVCKHSYALVDSTVKELPEGHQMRVEGIGVPKHYSVPLTAVVTN